MLERLSSVKVKDARDDTCGFESREPYGRNRMTRCTGHGEKLEQKGAESAKKKTTLACGGGGMGGGESLKHRPDTALRTEG